MNGNLSYQQDNDRFMLVWKTDKSWSGSCRQLEITLKDGTTHTASFTFK